MEIIPGKGTDAVKFGMNREKVKELLGPPVGVDAYGDTAGYPCDREIWNYGPFDILMTPAHGVTSITVDCEAAEPSLWGHSLAGCNEDALTRLIKQSGEKNEVIEQSYVEDCTIYLPDAHLNFYLMDDELVSVEVMRPDWKPPV